MVLSLLNEPSFFGPIVQQVEITPLGFCCRQDPFLFLGVNGLPGAIGLCYWIEQSTHFDVQPLLGLKQVAVNGRRIVGCIFLGVQQS